MRVVSTASWGLTALALAGGCLDARREATDPAVTGAPGSTDGSTTAGGGATTGGAGTTGGVGTGGGMGTAGSTTGGSGGPRTGPQIACSPTGLDFGLNAVGISWTLSILCTNVGTTEPNLFLPASGSSEPALAIENGDPAFLPAFDQPFPAEGLATGQTVKINVTYAPTVGGADVDSLIVSSNDLLNPRTPISLAGTAKKLASCDFVFNPASGLAFGHVDKGSDAVLPFEVINNGTDDCGPLLLYFEPGSCPAFSLIGPSGPTSSLTLSIDGGSSVTVEIQYAPTGDTGECTATLCIDLPSTQNPPTCISLTRSQPLSGCLLILPNPIDFGTTGFDAATGTWNKSETRTVTIRNICDTQDVDVRSISIFDPATNQGQPQPEFVLGGDPSPVTVPRVCSQSANCPPPTDVSFQVAFEPYTGGPDTAEVHVFTSDLPDPYIVSLQGNAE